MNHKLLLSALVAAMLLAGCAQNDGTEEPTTTTGATPTATTPSDVSEDEARAQFEQSLANIPDQYGMKMVLNNNGTDVLTMEGAFDNTTETAYMRMTIDPAALEDSGGDESFNEVLQDGFSVYVTRDGAYYLLKDTAFVFPPSDEGGEGDFVPSPDAAFGEFLDPRAMLAVDEDEDGFEVKSVEPTTWKGKSALRMVIETEDEDNETTTATVVMYTDPRLPAHVEAQLNPDEEDASDPFSGGTMTMDFLYGDEVEVQIPENADRALGLAYTSDANPFDFGGSGDVTYENWTFNGDAGIALADVEVQVKDSSSADPTDVTGSADLPTLWSMSLADGTMTQDGLTITFHDEDGSDTVSPGDRLEIVNEGDASATSVMLYDTVSQTYVVPGVGLWALLAGLGAVALLARRRA